MLPLALYLGLYTWNWETGHLDRFAASTGLEGVGWVLAPGKWVHNQAQYYLDHYVRLVQTSKENERLREEIQELELRLIRMQNKAAEAQRLRELLELDLPEDWSYTGARIIADRVSPSGAMETLILNKGSSQAVHKEMAALTPKGLAGKVIKTSRNFSQLLLPTDPNSNIPVVSYNNRSRAILTGQGPDSLPKLEYMTRDSPLSEGELLLTSGMGDVFPKGIPVARVVKVEQAEHSLFQEVRARLLTEFSRLEEVLLLQTGQKIEGEKTIESLFDLPSAPEP